MTASTVYWIDGTRTASLPLPDRGLDFGDGLFETFLLAHDCIFYRERHFQRMRSGLLRLGFPDCTIIAEHQLNTALKEALELGINHGALRMTVTRGAGPRGYTPPIDCEPRLIIALTPTAKAWDAFPDAVSLGIASIRLAAQSQLAGIKHLNRLEQVMAARECARDDVDDLLMLDQDGGAISVISGNLFAAVKDVIITPRIETCGVLGTRRQALIDSWAPALGLQVEQRSVSPAELEEADEIFVTNSIIGLRPISRLGRGRWRSYPVCEALHAIYCRENL